METPPVGVTFSSKNPQVIMQSGVVRQVFKPNFHSGDGLIGCKRYRGKVWLGSSVEETTM